jgi:hypothetical protein
MWPFLLGMLLALVCSIAAAPQMVANALSDGLLTPYATAEGDRFLPKPHQRRLRAGAGALSG